MRARSEKGTGMGMPGCRRTLAGSLSRSWIAKTAWIACLVAAFSLVPSAARAEPGDEYTVSVLTMGPGEPVFFRFGHNAIWVHNNRTHLDEVYNWGTFSFEEPGLIVKFLRGLLTYWLSMQSYRGTVAQYHFEGRSLDAQELNLTAAQKLRLVMAVRENARPENARYRYHYYEDNCSTRVRDAVDTVIGGRLHDVSRQPSALSYRDETSRLTADVWWAYVILNATLGPYLDQPVNEWQLMFAPGRLQEGLRKATNVDSAGNVVPLVRVERSVLESHQFDARPEPPHRKGALFALGAAVGIFLAGLGAASMRRRNRTSRRLAIIFALATSTLGAVAGFIGVLFVLLWTITNHASAYRNENLLLISPLAFALPVVMWGVARGRLWGLKAFEWIGFALAAMAWLGLAAKLSPRWFPQHNGEIIALMLPIWTALGVVAWLARRSRRTASSPQLG